MISPLANTSANFMAERAEEGVGGTSPMLWAQNHFGHQTFIRDQS